jgi:hypothetical protein
MDPALILDNKSKEKALAEEMKKKYDTSMGNLETGFIGLRRAQEIKGAMNITGLYDHGG